MCARTSACLWTSAANNIVFSGEALRQPPVINYILKGYHSLALQVGDIVEGKVTGIKPFGAFVSLPEGKTGLVHISEVSYEFVQDLSAVLSDGQTVSVKVLSIAPDGKIALSIKRLLPPPPRQPREGRGPRASRTVSAAATAVIAARPRAPSARKSPACGSPSPPPPKAR